MASAYDGDHLGQAITASCCQACCQRAGVLSLDRADTYGGRLATVDPPPSGFLHDAHWFHRALTAMPWYGDLGLERHGARSVEPELNMA